MKRSFVLNVSVFTIMAISCGSPSGQEEGNKKDTITVEQPAQPEPTVAAPASDTLQVSGKITKIENGKDGYMATIKDSTGKEFIATISVVNLQKSGGQFKRHEVGETISVSGPSWKDEKNIEHITVAKLN